MLAVEVLGVALWSVLGLAGAWLLLTGRKMIFGLPRDFREGWPVRLFGLIYLAIAMFVIYQAFRGSFSADGVVFAYVIFALAITWELIRRRRQRAGRRA